ncbi:Hypothetical predicted protein [Olea europaea subsp. europaea]|uniref:Uncharacterized protein n=1 Tax=Olea europaea subsp. europaea TaxID=158383 RepID=A0A8S0T7W2_OLEEU|nr:Hypothetical predicted protein [Olea europaea subsp. europaea]
MRPPRGHDNFGGYGFRGKRNGGGCGSCFDGSGCFPTHDEGEKFYIDPTKFLLLSRFLPQPKRQAQTSGRGGEKGGGRGGRGGGYFHRRGAPSGRDGPRGGGRGGGFRGRGRS